MEKKKAIDIDTYIIGYPCYKPIIRSIDSPGDIPEFERFIFGIAKMDHLSDAEMFEMLEDLKQRYLYDSCALFGEDFYKLSEEMTEKEKLPADILSRKKIRTHSQCAAYYKEYQSNQNACFACIRSPLYANKYLKEELAILKYMLSGEENCKYIESKVEDLGIEFLGVIDIFFDQRTKTTVYLPMNRLFYTYISNNDSTLFFKTMVENVEKRIEFLMQLFDDEYISMKEIPAEFKMDGLKKRVAFRRHFERVEEASDLTRSDADELLTKIKAFQQEREERINAFSALRPSQKSTYISYSNSKNIENKRKEIVLEESPKQTYLDITDIFAAANQSGDIPEQTKEPKESEDIVHPDITKTVEPVTEEITEPNLLQNQDISIEGCPAMQEEEPELASAPFEETFDKAGKESLESDPELVENYTEEEKRAIEEELFEQSDNLSSCFSLCLYNTKKHFIATDYPKYRYEKDDLVPYKELNPLMDSSVFGDTCLNKEQQSAFRPIRGNLISLSELEDAALNDRCIAVEVVRTEIGMALVLFTSTRHLFVITSMKNKTELKVIGHMLRRNGLKKVCYQPYLLYAFCYENGIKINGVHSLFTNHIFLHPGVASYGLRDLILENISSNKEYVREKLQTSTNLLYDSMRYYKKVFVRQQKEQKKMNLANLSLMEEFDRAIGYSYLLGGSMQIDARLFDRKNGNEIIFNNQIYLGMKNRVRFSGYFATYEFPVWTKHATSITTRFLCNLSKENVFGEYNIQIVALYKNRVTFFIAKEEFDYLDAVIGTSLRSVASQYGEPDLPVAVVFEYHKSSSETTAK